MKDPKIATKTNISEAIGQQISKKHDWLPESVVGRAGLRPLDSSNIKEPYLGKIGLAYSREGIKETSSFSSVPTNIGAEENVTASEWEVSFYFTI